MRAVRWHGRGDVRLDEVPPPGPPAEGEIQLHIAWCGICGTDIEEYHAGPKFIPTEAPHPLTGRRAPLILGHEFAGTVVAVGAAVTQFREGDRVAADTLIPCNRCCWCRAHLPILCDQLAAVGLMADGGLAELCNAPALTCLPVPASVPLDAAALAETAAVAIRAVRRGRVQHGDSVAVVGAGPVGLMALQAARTLSDDVTVVEPVAERRSLALALGASAAVGTEAGAGLQVDVAIECSGHPSAVQTALDVTGKRGRVVLVGIYSGASTVQMLPVVVGEREIVGSLSHVYDEDFRQALELLAVGHIRADPLISDRLPLERAVDDGFRALITDPARHLKILISPELAT